VCDNPITHISQQQQIIGDYAKRDEEMKDQEGVSLEDFNKAVD
jgi:hypothetical protein